MTSSGSLDALRPDANAIVHRAGELLQSWTAARTAPLSEEDLSSLHLAHYTSLETIVYILQTPDGGLRLSDTSTMNDPEEGCTTMEDRAISRLLESEFGKESWLWQRYGAANVCCFVGIVSTSEPNIDAGDDLLFWRLYGNDCRGVSITVPPHASRPLVESSTVDRVMYTDEPPREVNQSLSPSLLRDLSDLRCRARDADLWSEISPRVLAAFDPLFKQRFLRKRPHYAMEREYRAVTFQSEDDLEDARYSYRGQHVQYGLIRRYVQIPELSCGSILTTNSQITIGSNVPESSTAKATLSSLLESQGKARGVVSVRVSKIPYRPR